MTFITNLWIVCLAELIKWSSPWYIRKMVSRGFKRMWPSLLFALTVMVFVLLPGFDKNMLYRESVSWKFPSLLLSAEDTPMPAREAVSWKSPSFLRPAEFEQCFPMPEELKPQVEFWKDIFVRYTSRQVVIHDSWDFQIVYDVIDLNHTKNINAVIKTYRQILHVLAGKEKHNKLGTLTSEEAKVYKLFEKIPEPDKFRKAVARPIRVQFGQRDRFMEAIRRSGLYYQRFARIFQEYGLPLELISLPFVESYFNHDAYSRAGAAGVWQFMPATARLYGLQMNNAIDERYDPFKSASSAAKLLKANYELFRSWPLAITAYNHGPAGIFNAIKQTGTSDIGKITSTYQGEKFGFYSRNYYAQFLAVAQIMQDPQQYFGEIECFPTIHYEEVTIGRQLFIDDLATLLAISKDQLVTLNRDLKPAVVESKAPVPPNFVCKLPPGKRRHLLLKLQELAALEHVDPWRQRKL